MSRAGDHAATRPSRRCSAPRPSRARPRRSPRGSACARSATCSTTSRAATSRTGELTELDDAAARASMLTVVGEIVESEVNTYQDRRTQPHGLPPRRHASRPTARRCACRSSPRPEHVSDWHAAAPAGRPARHVHRPGRARFRGQWQLTNPHDGAVRRSTTPTRRSAPRSASIKALFPLYPPDQGRRLVGPRSARSPSPSTVVDDVPDPLPDAVRDDARPARPAARRSDWIHAPRLAGRQVDGRRSAGSGSTRRW